MKSIPTVFAEACRLMERDAQLRIKQAALDRIANLEYNLPEPMQELEWMRKVVSTAPYDAIEAAARALSNLDEIIKIEPVTALGALPAGTKPHSAAARAKANEWETVLKWQLGRAGRRSPSFRSDVVSSATKYHEIIGQVIYLPVQGAAKQALKRSSKRYENAMRFGDFVINLKNPQNVHAVFSPYQLEAVLCVEVYDGWELKEHWGVKADGLKDDEKYVCLDYHSLEERVVLAFPGELESDLEHFDPEGKDGEKLVTLVHEPNKHPYLPWVCKVGGTGLEKRPEMQRRPLLNAVYAAELWVTDAIMRSIAVSKELATIAEPRHLVEGPDPASVQIDYGEPGNRVDVLPGHKYTPLPPSQLDPKQFQIADRLEQAIATATVARVLVTAEAQPGESYSGYNLRIKNAIGSLVPFKSLAEAWFEEVLRTMLYHVHYHKGTLKGYAVDRKTRGAAPSIEWREIDPNCLYLSVELTPDLPIDRLQQINAAVLMAQNLQVSPIYTLEYLGIPDPEGAMREWAFWRFQMAEVEGMVQRVQAEASGQYQADVAAAAQAMLQQQMEQQATQEQQQAQLAPPGLEQMGGGQPGTGIGFAPPMGGMPFAGADPNGNVREQATGMDRMGNEGL